MVTDPEEEVLPESRSSEEEEEQTERPTAEPPDDGGEGRGGGILNKCILLALIVAISMGFGHFYGRKFTQKIQFIFHNYKSRKSIFEGLFGLTRSVLTLDSSSVLLLLCVNNQVQSKFRKGRKRRRNSK